MLCRVEVLCVLATVCPKCNLTTVFISFPNIDMSAPPSPPLPLLTPPSPVSGTASGDISDYFGKSHVYSHDYRPSPTSPSLSLSHSSGREYCHPIRDSRMSQLCPRVFIIDKVGNSQVRGILESNIKHRLVTEKLEGGKEEEGGDLDSKLSARSFNLKEFSWFEKVGCLCNSGSSHIINAGIWTHFEAKREILWSHEEVKINWNYYAI